MKSHLQLLPSRSWLTIRRSFDTFFRVYSGVLNSEFARAWTLLKVNVNVSDVSFKCTPTLVKIETVYSGDIAAAVGLKDTTTVTHWQMKKQKSSLDQSKLETSYQLMVEPKSKADQDKMGIALQKVAEEDPAFHVWKQNPETGWRLSLVWVSCTWMSLLTVWSNDSRLKLTLVPQSILPWSIPRFYTTRGFFKRQSGGKGQFGDVWINLPQTKKVKDSVRKYLSSVVWFREFIPT